MFPLGCFSLWPLWVISMCLCHQLSNSGRAGNRTAELGIASQMAVCALPRYKQKVVSLQKTLFLWTTSDEKPLEAVCTKMLFCEKKHALRRFVRPYTRILKTQRLKTHFFETESQCGKTQKRSPPVFMCTAKTITLSPHPSTSCLRPLNPTASHHNDNNNGGLHACFHPTEDIEPFLQLTRLIVECESQQEFDVINGPTNESGILVIAIVIFFLLRSDSLSTVCLYTEHKLNAHALSLFLFFGEFQAPPIGLKYEL